MNNTQRIALTGAFTAIYVVSTYALGSLSYGIINLRLSDILTGIVPILGWPSVIGLTIGVLLSNIGSPLGPIDLISTIPSFVGFYFIYRLRNRSVFAGLCIYSTIISMWVAFELSIVLRIPFIYALFTVSIGIFIVICGFAYLVYKGLDRAGIRRIVERKTGNRITS